MSKFKVKKLPPIKLTDLLKKRKTNLKQFLSSTGITTYVTLEQKCASLGVSIPGLEEFQDAVGTIVSSPQEGVVVLDPPSLLKETGEKIQIEEKTNNEVVEPVKESDVVESQLTLTAKPVASTPVKSWKKKKDIAQPEET